MPTNTYMPDNADQMPGAALNVYQCAGAPVDGTSGTLAGIIGKGRLICDVTNANVYINSGSISSPVFKLITRAA